MFDQTHILLAEDDENDVMLMRRAFTKSRIANPLQTVSNGEEAIAYLKGDGNFLDRAKFPLPCLLLLDLKMPKKNGFEVLEWLQQQAPLKRLLTIVLTSSRESRDINMAYDLGANSYLVKPADFQKLMDLLRSLENYWLALNQRPECIQPQ
jgi:CheY-like chemotaxis protein